MFFYVLIFLTIVIVEIILLSTLKVEIRNFKISTEKYKERFIDRDYKITISLWGLRKVRFLNLQITKEKLENLNIKNKIKTSLKKFDFEALKNNKNLKLNNIKKAKKYLPKITYINLVANIGTDDAVLTSYIVAAISSILGLLLKKQIANSKNNKFTITPLYINKNLLNLEFNCIFETKLIHIIYIIYILNKKGRVNKNVRTSNRRSYGYSYE
ncbi:MAG: hypothetical protein IKF17_02005 [Clostridia bacterium]|nr:hypothetical protein [Clostridia bacterium]